MTQTDLRKFAGLNIVGPGDTPPQGLCLSVYGTGGSGKTTLVSEVVLSKYGTPGLHVDIEGGSSSVLHLRDKGLDIVQPTTWDQVIAIKRSLEREKHQYKSVIFDNISEILSLCVKKFAPTGMPEGNMALKIWGQVNAAMMEFTRETRSMSITDGINVLSVLWEETEKDELSGLIRKKVNLTPKFGAAFPGMVTMVGRLTVPGTATSDYIRKLSFAPSVETDAKFRVAPTDEAAKIPLEVWLRRDSHFLVDFLATVKEGIPFPIAKYAAPQRTQNNQNSAS